MLDIFTLPLSDVEDEYSEELQPGIPFEPSRFPVSTVIVSGAFPVDIVAGQDSLVSKNTDAPYASICEVISPDSDDYIDLTEDDAEESIGIAQVDFDFLLDNDINDLLSYPADI